jgi:hypothetical protein
MGRKSHTWAPLIFGRKFSGTSEEEYLWTKSELNSKEKLKTEVKIVVEGRTHWTKMPLNKGLKSASILNIDFR